VPTHDGYLMAKARCMSAPRFSVIIPKVYASSATLLRSSCRREANAVMRRTFEPGTFFHH
jgi:hypothetical protein